MTEKLSSLLKFIDVKLDTLRFAGLDQNPSAIRDLIGASVFKAEALEAAAGARTDQEEFDAFHNRLRILASIDLAEFRAAGLHSFAWGLLVKDPRDFFVRTDTETARKVWSIIRARESRSAT